MDIMWKYSVGDKEERREEDEKACTGQDYHLVTELLLCRWFTEISDKLLCQRNKPSNLDWTLKNTE